MRDIFSFFEKPKDPLSFSAMRISLASPEKDPGVVARRGEEAGDDQLPHLQARARRPVLREDLRAGEGLRVHLRQVQAHEAPRHRVREVRRRGDSVEGAPRAPGPHQPGDARRAHLVLEEPAVAHRQHPRHHAEGPRKVLYCEAYIVIDARATGARARRALRASATRSCIEEYGEEAFEAGMGGEAVLEMLKRVDVHSLAESLRADMIASDQRGEAEEVRQAPEGRRGLPRSAATVRSG